jgi:hypothetical protein
MEIDIAPQTIQAIGWFYALTSALRVVAYAPQVALVWRCPEGGRSVSLVTWVASALSHAAGVIYGVAVVADPCLTAIAVGNTAGSLAIVWVALVRRGSTRGALLSRMRSVARAMRPRASTAAIRRPAGGRQPVAPSPSRPGGFATAAGTAAH